MHHVRSHPVPHKGELDPVKWILIGRRSTGKEKEQVLTGSRNCNLWPSKYMGGTVRGHKVQPPGGKVEAIHHEFSHPLAHNQLPNKRGYNLQVTDVVH